MIVSEQVNDADPPAPSYRARLARANELLTSLVSEIRAWEDRAHRFPVEGVDPQTGRHVVTLSVSEPPPVSWGPIIGDILHNCRSALDHAAYALVVTDRGLPLSEKIEKSTEFPIFSTPELFERNGRRSIAGMSEEAQAAVESVQPYHRGTNWAIDPLWMLHELSNIDKHRRPALTALYIEPNPDADSRLETGRPGPARPGVPYVIGTYERESDDDTSQVTWGYGFGLAFDENLAWTPPYVPHILHAIWATIAGEVFGTLESFF